MYSEYSGGDKRWLIIHMILFVPFALGVLAALVCMTVAAGWVAIVEWADRK